MCHSATLRPSLHCPPTRLHLSPPNVYTQRVSSACFILVPQNCDICQRLAATHKSSWQERCANRERGTFPKHFMPHHPIFTQAYPFTRGPKMCQTTFGDTEYHLPEDKLAFFKWQYVRQKSLSIHSGSYDCREAQRHHQRVGRQSAELFMEESQVRSENTPIIKEVQRSRPWWISPQQKLYGKCCKVARPRLFSRACLGHLDAFPIEKNGNQQA